MIKKEKETYTWSEINKALHEKGYSAKRILDILTTIVKSKRKENK